MASIAKIQDFAQEYSDNLAEILGLDVSIIDHNNIRVAGTGLHRQLIGKPVPKGSFFETILKTGRPGIIFDRREGSKKCRNCIFNKQCTELATVGFPIIKKNKPVGVIGFIGFTSRQKKMIVEHSGSLSKYLQNISTLFENKLSLEDCQFHEQAPVPPKSYTFDSIIGTNAKFQSLIEKARKISKSPSSVLIRGENGTGKELLAQAIHYGRTGINKPFISVNCGAIPEHLLESELFGYDGGAFTGAKRQGKEGKFELANNGTIFLDEIGDLPLSMQSKLLRVLQEKYIERIGGNQIIPLDVRVIAATNKDLESMVKKGTFREDLYYRINVIPLHVMPLRERRDDIPLLLAHYTGKYSLILDRGIPGMNPMLEKWLMNYDWPGNIRHLQNVVEYMMNMNETDLLDFDDLPEYMKEDIIIKPETQLEESMGLTELVSECERNILLKHISSDSSNIDKEEIAKKLNISLTTLYRKLGKHQIY
ncbi:sigma 54-interacting transcriptional regulator [Pseudalkalibacillus decolorationis]|uniref:sigma 54-interacting transcriptional regulator n=1 Tax=Pseudalkalibacillus decolorationis TaxID=163879 RepID=UPI002147F827|nr:sigma 54-interacting transcriptional regulator [Pseudalkalibacillus decolorationis]